MLFHWESGIQSSLCFEYYEMNVDLIMVFFTLLWPFNLI